MDPATPAASAPTTPLPAGFTIVLDPSVRRPHSTLLVGGSPLRVMRLSEQGVRMVEGWAAGEPVPSSLPARRLARRMVDAGMAHPRPPPDDPPLGAVTVVIPVRDRPAGLADTLSRLDSGGGLVAAVIVVDDASRDPDATGSQVVTSPDYPVTVLRRPRQGGPAAARNSGWRAARSPLVAFVDADCRPEPGWLGPLVAHFADPAVAAVAPRVVSRAAEHAPAWLVAYESGRSPLDLGGAPALVRPRSRVPYVPTAALVVRRAALEMLGGFDEAMQVGEDVDLIWRLCAAGWRVRYEPANTVAHPTRTTAVAALRQRFDYGRSAAALADRHGSAVSPLDANGWSVIAWSIAAAGWPAAGLFVAAGTCLAWPFRQNRPPLPAADLIRLAATGHVSAGLALGRAVRRAWWPLVVPLLRWRRFRPALWAVAVGVPLVDWVRLQSGAPAGGSPGSPLKGPLRPATPLKGPLGPATPLKGPLGPATPLKGPLGPGRWVLLATADDLAYGAGVWAGVLAGRSLAALRPQLRFG